MANHQGSLFKDPDGRWSGYLALLLDELKRDMGFEVVETQIQASDDASRFTNCVLDASRNLTDICLGTFWETPGRSKLASYSAAFEQAEFMLLVKSKEATGHVLERTFFPFEYSFWLFFMGASLFFAVALWLAEKGKGGDVQIGQGLRGCLESFWLTMAGLVNAGLVGTPLTVAGRCISIAWGFLVLVVLAAYTANLAAFLTVRRSIPVYERVQNVLDHGHTVCLQNTIKAAILGQYPTLSILDFGNDNSAIERFLESSLTDGCQAAIVEMNLFRAQQKDDWCNADFVGPLVLAVPIGFPMPISQPWEHELSNHIDEYRFKGKMDTWMRLHRKVLTCPRNEEDEQGDNPRISIFQMSGGLGVAALFLSLGCVIMAVKKIRKICQFEALDLKAAANLDQKRRDASLSKKIGRTVREVNSTVSSELRETVHTVLDDSGKDSAEEEKYLERIQTFPSQEFVEEIQKIQDLLECNQTSFVQQVTQEVQQNRQLLHDIQHQLVHKTQQSNAATMSSSSSFPSEAAKDEKEDRSLHYHIMTLADMRVQELENQLKESQDQLSMSRREQERREQGQFSKAVQEQPSEFGYAPLEQDVDTSPVSRWQERVLKQSSLAEKVMM